MTSRIQTFLLNNTVFLQKLVNEKLANGPILPNVWKWFAIGKRGMGDHTFPKYFRLFNALSLSFGNRMNNSRPHLGKYLFSKEREFFMTGYAAMLIILALWTRKNKIRPLYEQNDSYIHEYDNPTTLGKMYGKIIPAYVTRYRQSAHYIEINRIFEREMLSKYNAYQLQIENEYENSSEKVKRTKYLRNPNYVYEPFGWEEEQSN